MQRQRRIESSTLYATLLAAARLIGSSGVMDYRETSEINRRANQRRISNLLDVTETELNSRLVMPRYKETKTLECLALSKLGDWIVKQTEMFMIPNSILAQHHPNEAQVTLSKYVDNIRNYLDFNVPWMLHDELANEAIKSLSNLIEKIKHFLGFHSMGTFVSQMNVAVKMTEALFTKNVTYVSLYNIPKIMHSVFYTKLYMLTGLVSLNLGSLSRGWETADKEEAIIKSLMCLHNLQYLVINYDCTDNILCCVVKHCPKLKNLDLSHSKCITNDSINLISELKSLKSVQLYHTFVTWEGYVNLLISCHGLEDIGCCDEIGKILEFIHINCPEAAPLELKIIVSRYATSTHLQLAVEICPYIRHMTVFHNTLQSDLMVITGLRDLCDLTLHSCDFYADNVKQVLQVKGCNIVQLRLGQVDQIDLNALMYISQMCPLLESLTFYNCTLIQHTSLYTKKLEILPFRNLKYFTCLSVCTDEHIMFILSNCLNVEFIQIGTDIQLTDDFLLKILDKNPLIFVKELRIMHSNFLSMLSVKRIIQSCMNLETLGELESWLLLSDSDRDYIRKYIKINNYNVDPTFDELRRYDA